MSSDRVGRITSERIAFDSVQLEIALELNRARDAFPAFHSAHEGYAVILEELDELWREVRSKQLTPGRNERMRKEATQVAAMAMRFILDMPGMKN